MSKTLTFKNTLYNIIDSGDIGNGWKYVEVVDKKQAFSLPKCLYYKGKSMKNLLSYTDYVNHLDMGKDFINDFVKDIFRECYPGSKNPICKVKENLMVGGDGNEDKLVLPDYLAKIFDISGSKKDQLDEDTNVYFNIKKGSKATDKLLHLRNQLDFNMFLKEIVEKHEDGNTYKDKLNKIEIKIGDYYYLLKKKENTNLNLIEKLIEKLIVRDIIQTQKVKEEKKKEIQDSYFLNDVVDKLEEEVSKKQLTLFRKENDEEVDTTDKNNQDAVSPNNVTIDTTRIKQPPSGKKRKRRKQINNQLSEETTLRVPKRAAVALRVQEGPPVAQQTATTDGERIINTKEYNQLSEETTLRESEGQTATPIKKEATDGKGKEKKNNNNSSSTSSYGSNVPEALRLVAGILSGGLIK